MPRKASPLSSSFIGNFTWSYIFIHHMICVLLGASFPFVSFCFLLVRIMFCIFSLNTEVKDSLCHAYFASIHVAVWKTESLPQLQKFPRKVREWYNVESFFILSYDKFMTVGILFQNFWSQGSIDTLASFTDYCFGRLLLCLHCLHIFACLMILFEDRSIKYTEAFSMQCWII